ncbi:S9 family peptidase [Steroidobacter cummioxidans]|uniref:S9 family peptidase n=1 Tax=Steroidobacter cummioxidans TaxID=1803913 RepID=UPI000E310422|nr:S9 family peptidase [Steroidobacter cummioxidans]
MSRSCARLAALVLLVGGAWTAAADVPPQVSRVPGLGADSLMQWSFVADPRIAPDERSIAYVLARANAEGRGYDYNVHVVTPTGEDRALTAHTAADRSPRWSPDGKRLGFLSNRNGAFQVFALDMSGGEPRQLTASDESVSSFEWSPDGSRIAYTAREARAEASEPVVRVSERLLYRREGEFGFRPDRAVQLWTADATSSTPHRGRRITQGDYDHASPVWSPDGSRLYFVANNRPDADARPDDTDIYSVAVDGSAPPVAVVERRGPATSPRVSPDGRWLAYVGYDEGDTPRSYTPYSLYLLSLVEPDAQPIRIEHPRGVTEGMISDSAAPGVLGERLAWSADSRWLYFISADRGATHLYRVNPQRRQVERRSAHTMGDLSEFTVGRSGLVAATFATPTQPAQIALIAERGKAQSLPRIVTSHENTLAPSLPFAGLMERESVSPDGQKIQYWLMMPPGFEPGRRYPTVLYVHGGPHAMYGTGFFHEFQVLASRGFAVAFGNPRGSTGYGAKFGNSIQNAYPGEDHRDLMAIVDDLVAAGYADPQRLAIAGGSGGGLLAGWAIGHTDRFAAAIVERAVTDWYSLNVTSDYASTLLSTQFSTMPWLDPAAFHSRSPLSLVGNVTTPVLVIHNEQDYRTPLGQGLAYYTALRMLNKPAKLAVFPDSNHGMSRDGTPRQRIARLHLIVEWLERHLTSSAIISAGTAGWCPACAPREGS